MLYELTLLSEKMGEVVFFVNFPFPFFRVFCPRAHFCLLGSVKLASHIYIYMLTYVTQVNNHTAPTSIGASTRCFGQEVINDLAYFCGFSRTLMTNFYFLFRISI